MEQVRGGNHPMHGNTGTGPQKPGVGSQEGSGAGKDPGAPPQAGPASGGFYSSGASNKDYAGTKTPGVSAQTKSGGNSKWAEGGKHGTLGNRGSLPAKGGCSAP